MLIVKRPGLALVKTQGLIGRYFDRIFEPLMFWLQGNKEELPQRTHFWNNYKFHRKNHRFLKDNLMACVQPDPEAVKRRLWGFIPIFHMPRFGGWKKYVALCPVENWSGGSWRVGWLLPDKKTEISQYINWLFPVKKAGISMIPLNGPVRCLIGDEKIKFFAIDTKGNQLPLSVTGHFSIGKGIFTDLTFL
jgi:hypothetical protein